MPHRYSPEFIFAKEFTRHYDEFAIYFPEFGRLRELSKAASLVNVMAAQRAANQEEVHLTRRRLNVNNFVTYNLNNLGKSKNIIIGKQLNKN